jgi:hypothetical protein
MVTVAVIVLVLVGGLVDDRRLGGARCTHYHRNVPYV